MPTEVLEREIPEEEVPEGEDETQTEGETRESSRGHPEHQLLRRQTSVQRELADAIVRLAPIAELKVLLLDLGANINGAVTQGLTPLHYAVWQRHIEAAEFLIDEGCDIDQRDDIGFSPLHLAAEHGYLDLVECLLKHGAKVNFNEAPPSEPFPVDVLDEPLRLAVKNGHKEVVRALLEHGANPNSVYFFGHEINLVNPFHTDMLHLLLSYGADPNARDRQSLTPLMKACRLHQGSSEEIERRQFVSGKEILLHFAEMLKGMDAVLLLISFGADVNMRADTRHDFRTVLHYAVLSGSVPIVNLLIKQGATLNFEPEYQRPSPMDLAILKGDVPIIKLFIESGVNVNASSPVIGSPLHVACSDGIKNRMEVLELLLEAGADPNLIIKNEDDQPLRTVLGEYLYSNDDLDVQVINLLLRFGTQVVMKSQHRDSRGILSDVPDLSNNYPVLLSILEAAHGYDLPVIKQSSIINKAQRDFYLKVGDSPTSLKHLVRVFIRKQDELRLPNKIDELEIPKILKKYLLYEIS